MTIEETSGTDGPASPPAPPPPAPWRMGAGRAWLILGTYVGVQVVVGFLIGVVAVVGYVARHGAAEPTMPTDLRNALALAGGAAAVVLGGAAAFGLVKRTARREAGILHAIGWSRASKPTCLAAALLGFAIGAGVLLMFVTFPPPPDFRGGRIVQALAAGGGWTVLLWSVVAVAIAPPIEEFVFRGVMWTGLSRSWNPWAAAIVVTAVFVAMHLTETMGYPPGLAGIGVMALAALAMRIASGSIVPSILLHAGYNAMIVAAMLAGEASK